MTVNLRALSLPLALLAAAATPGGRGQDDAPVVTLDAQQIESAGVVTAAVAPGRVERWVEAPAVASAPTTATWHVNARLPGMVREVRVEPGDEVAAGDVLCVVESLTLGEAVHDYLRSMALVEAHERALPLRRGVLDRAVAEARAALEIERELAQRELNTLREVRAAEDALRDRELARDTTLLELETRLADERLELLAAAEHLRLLGVEVEGLHLAHADEPAAEQAEALARASDAHLGRYEVRAPAAGLVVDRDAMPGEYVSEERTLVELRDLSTMWVLARVNERDLSSVHREAEARVLLPAFPEAVFEGRVGLIAFELDTGTRSAAVRVELPNRPVPGWSEPWPVRPGMSARARFLAARHEAALALPASAIWSEGERDRVFVAVAPGRFELREVRLGVRSDESAEVLAGLRSDEAVAVSGLFLLKTMLARQVPDEVER